MSKQGHYRYYGTPDTMTQQEAYHCERYLRRNRDALFLSDRFLLDIPALMRPFHLDCVNCRKVHRETCCENGQPYAVETEQAAQLNDVTAEIAERYFSSSLQHAVARMGIWDQSKTAGTPRMSQGSCLFFQQIEGIGCCAIHAHAEREGLDVFALKPFSCQLYPLELIQVGDYVLITALTEETARFSRWGSDYLEHFYCASRERRLQATHLPEEWFAPSGYRPAYQWGKTLLCRSFGEKLCEDIERLATDWNLQTIT